MSVTATQASVRYRFGCFELQPVERRLLAHGAAVRVGPHALDLLLVFVERPGRLVTKEELLARVWRAVVVEPNTLQVHVAALRKVLGTDVISTVSGQGYRFTPAVERIDDALESSLSERSDNLPHQLTSFIGREDDIAHLRQLLASTRLLTLTGAGGCGKSRLALQVARDTRDSYADGVWLVELAPLAVPTLIPQTMAAVLGIQEQPGKDLTTTLVQRLETKHLLLLVDNAEHLLGSCAELLNLILTRCARVAVVVTSREPLGITGELTYRVPSLSVPGEEADSTPMQLLSFEAALLFVERAKLQRPDFAVTASNAAALASICRRLDGIALAIELAAARARSMSIEEIDRHLDDRFDVLGDGSRTALPRHRTLRSLIDWSYDLLSDAEKTLLQRVSVFAGGWTLDAAQRVCSGDRIDASDVLKLLTSLTDKSLLTVDTHDEQTRFGMLETVRHYAEDQLRGSQETEQVQARHLQLFMDTAEGLRSDQNNNRREITVKQLDKEHENLRTALAWCRADATRSIDGLRLAGKLVFFWMTRGHYLEGRTWIDGFLAASQGDTEERALASNAAANLAYYQDDYAASEAYDREAMEIWQRLGRTDLVASTLGNMGTTAVNRGDYRAARDLLGKALAHARAIGHRGQIESWSQSLGVCTLEMGAFAEAQTLLAECLPLSREVGKVNAAITLAQLGLVVQAQGEYQRARTLLTEALEGVQEFGEKAFTGRILVWLGSVSHDLGDVSLARIQLSQGLEILRQLGERLVVAEALEAFAALSVASTSPTEALRLWGCTQRLREEIGAPQPAAVRLRCERYIAAARGQLNDDAAFDLAWAEGRSLSLEEAVRAVVNP
jgi:predicted ATPase/DNA-binding winged helix-turn-helix (wHTH) protein